MQSHTMVYEEAEAHHSGSARAQTMGGMGGRTPPILESMGKKEEVTRGPTKTAVLMGCLPAIEIQLSVCVLAFNAICWLSSISMQ